MALSIGELVGYVTLNTTGVTRGVVQTEAQMGKLSTTMSSGMAAAGANAAKVATEGGALAANGWVRGADGKLRDASGRFVSAGEQAAAGLGKGLNKTSGYFDRVKRHVGLLAGTIGALSVAHVIGESVSLEAAFSKTFAQIAAATGAPKEQLDSLKTLAMQLGKDTVFSANDASDAMLELAKAGIKTNDIMGATKGVLTLAAAGGTDMGTAATIAANAMNTFALKGKDMDSIAAALAGGANASSASVESLGQALQQVGPGAKNAGLSLQETVGALAAFDSAGIKGSDAGTSLKTMLTRLIPQTKGAALAMQSVGLFSSKTGSAFVKANGQFKSLGQVSGLLHKHLSGLSEAQRTQALTTIFGSDSSRAASVLMNEGTKGIGKFVKATKDQDAAQKMAAAGMSGTAGAIENMKGSIETAELAFGQLLAPAVQDAAKDVGKFASVLGSAASLMARHRTTVKVLAGVIAGLTAVVIAYNAAQAVGAAGGMLQWLKATKLVTAATKVQAAVQWALNGAMDANPIMLVVIGIAALVAALVIAYKKSETFRAIVQGAFQGVRDVAKKVLDWLTNAIGNVIDWIRQHWRLLASILGGPLVAVVLLVQKHWDKIKEVTKGAIDNTVDWVRAIPDRFLNGLASLGNRVSGVFRDAMQGGKDKVIGLGSDIVSWVSGIPDKLANLAGRFGAAGRELLQGFIDGMRNAAGIIAGIANSVWNTVKGLLNGAIDKINAALEFRIDLPLGKHVTINPPDIPHLRTGGRVGANSPQMAWIGDATEPESVLRDSQLRVLLREAVASAAAGHPGRGGTGGPLIGAVYQQPGEDANVLAERLWFKTRTRG